MLFDNSFQILIICKHLHLVQNHFKQINTADLVTLSTFKNMRIYIVKNLTQMYSID